MIRLTSTNPVEYTTPGGVWIIDPVARTVDEQTGHGPRPFTEREEQLIPTPEQIAAFAAEAALAPLLQEAETLRQQMFVHTDQIIAWCQAASAFMFGPRWQVGDVIDYANPSVLIEEGDPRIGSPRFGAFDPSAFVALLQQAETYLLSYKALAVKPQAVADQRDWMLQRGQQAQSLLALAAVMS